MMNNSLNTTLEKDESAEGNGPGDFTLNHITGAAHWETLLRARAIETGCFVLAPAQTGFHPETAGKGRRQKGTPGESPAATTPAVGGRLRSRISLTCSTVTGLCM